MSEKNNIKALCLIAKYTLKALVRFLIILDFIYTLNSRQTSTWK